MQDVRDVTCCRAKVCMCRLMQGHKVMQVWVVADDEQTRLEVPLAGGKSNVRLQ